MIAQILVAICEVILTLGWPVYHTETPVRSLDHLPYTIMSCNFLREIVGNLWDFSKLPQKFMGHDYIR